MKQPYISISGVTSSEEIECIADAFARSGFAGSDYQPTVGFLMSRSSLSKPSSNKKPKRDRRTIKLAELPELLHATNKASLQTVIHYSTYYTEYSKKEYSKKDESTLIESLKSIFNYEEIFANGLCTTLQLNGFDYKLESDQLKDLKESLKGLQMIIQYREKTINSSLAINLVRRHELLMESKDDTQSTYPDCLLLDSSTGSGAEFNPTKKAKLIDHFSKHCPSLGLGVAGGLTPDNVASKVSKIKNELKQELYPADLFRACRPFSVDVESGVRSQYGIDKAKVHAYLTNLAGVLMAR